MLRPSLRYVDVYGRYDRLDTPLSFGSTMRSGYNLVVWRCRLNLSMFLLTIFVGHGRFWSVQSVLEILKDKLEDHVRHRKGFLDRFISYGFSRVFVLYPEQLQSRKELVCM